jgi:heme-degrading monooxygenase HmoA
LWEGRIVAEHASVVRVTHFQPAAGKRDELIAVLERLAGSIRGMDGCFGVQVCSVRETPEELVVISRWASQSAVEPMAQFVASNAGDVNPLVAGQARTEHYTPL